MKKYRVKVNGKVYEVELEEITKTDKPITMTKKEVTTNNNGTKVKTFMQGVIIDVKVKEGQDVIEGQPLAILEAMKMENEIVSPVSGTVTKIYVNKQDRVENHEVIMIIS